MACKLWTKICLKVNHGLIRYVNLVTKKNIELFFHKFDILSKRNFTSYYLITYTGTCSICLNALKSQCEPNTNLYCAHMYKVVTIILQLSDKEI